MFDLLMEEIAAIYRELSEEIGGVKSSLKAEIGEVKTSLKAEIDEVKTDVKKLKGDMSILRLKTDQNFLTFMNHVESYDRRLTALER